MASPPPGLYTFRNVGFEPRPSLPLSLDKGMVSEPVSVSSRHRKLEPHAPSWLGFSGTGSYESESARDEDHLPGESRSLEHDFTSELPTL